MNAAIEELLVSLSVLENNEPINRAEWERTRIASELAGDPKIWESWRLDQANFEAARAAEIRRALPMLSLLSE